MKNIGIDARLYSQTGVGVYIRNLIFYLQKLSPRDIKFNIYILNNDAVDINFNKGNFVKREVSYKWHTLAEQIGFYKVLSQDNLDLVHFTYFSYPVLYSKRFIATVHDLTPLYFKTGRASAGNRLIYEIKHNAFKYILKSQVKGASHIITPTQTVKNQILQTYGSEYEKKISVEYEGLDYALNNLSDNKLLKEKFTQPFFLYVGNFYPHKNIEKLVGAFSKTDVKAVLVLVGPNDYFSSRINQIIHRLKQEQRIHLYTASSRSDIVFFYQHALALINPSLSEGFGLPIVEAAHFNLPIMASEIEVFKELLGNNYLQFDPTSERDMTEKIESFIAERPKYNYEEFLKKCSFETMSAHTLNLYKSFLG